MTTKVRAVRRHGSFCDYTVFNPIAPHNPSILAEKIAKRITSKHNQHITIIMVGNTGTGKSWAAIDLAYETAKAVAKIDLKKAVTSDSWREYFNLDHMAIITLDRVVALLQNIRSHGIYILDDIGVGYSNRDWMKEKNKGMNKIIQTFRTDNTCVIYTVPSKGFIDKVPRELVEWYFEFERSEQVFSLGINSCKFLDITTLKRENKQLFIYDVVHSLTGASQFVRHIARRPPDELTVPYEKLRLDIARELREDIAAEIEGGGGSNGKNAASNDGDDGISPSQMKTVHHFVDVNELRKTGLSVAEACEEEGFNKTTYEGLRNGRSGWFTDYMRAAGLPIVPQDDEGGG